MKPLFSLGVATGLMLSAAGLIAGQPLLVPAGGVLLAVCAWRACSVSPPKDPEPRMLSEAEAARLRAEVHAALVAERYDLARAKLEELAQRSRGTWPGPTQPRRGPWWTALLWRRR
jgi:hypothetical protein